MAGETTSLSIIRTKLHRPPVASDHVHRVQMLDRLTERLYRPFTLVSAPAGYGKSTLVSCWAEAIEIPSAWISLDENDSDLHLFLSYFVAAVQTVFPNACQKTGSVLNAVGLPSVEVLAGSLINELDQVEKAFILVLDDYHLIKNNTVHELLSGLLKHPPAPLHLVLVTRRDPPLPLAVFRAQSRMTEIRVQELRFSASETAAFLQKVLNSPVDKSTAAILEKKTEGWVTGLRLAALSLRHRSNLDHVLENLPEDNRYVMDYIVGEVIAQQPPDVQEFLLTSSVLDRFCAPLCDAVCPPGTEPGTCAITGQEFLKRLEQSNLFVIPLDDLHRWFRYHHLFQRLLQRRLKRKLSPDDIAALHKQAAKWFAEKGMLDEAFRHTLVSGDISAAIRLVAQHRHDLMNQEQWHLLDRFLSQLPADSIENKLELLTLKAWSCENRSRLQEMATVLSKIETFMTSSPGGSAADTSLQGEIEALTAARYYYASDGSRTVAHAEQALEKLDSNAYSVRGFAAAVLAFGYQMMGNLKSAYKTCHNRLGEEFRHGTTYHYRLLIGLCFVQWIAADLKGLNQSANQYLKLAYNSDLPEAVVFARYFKGIALYQRNELTEAEKHLNLVVKNRYLSNTLTFAHSAFVLSLAYQALKRPDEARQAVELVITYSIETHNTPLMQLAHAFMLELDLRQGGTAEARQLTQIFEAQPFSPTLRYYVPQLTLAKVLIATGTTENHRQADDLLSRLLNYYKTTHNTRCQTEITALQAMHCNALGKESEALEKLTRAIILAEPGGFIRLFVDLGPKMVDLLSRLAKRKTSAKYVGRLLAAFENEEIGTVQTTSDGQTDAPLSLINEPLAESLTNRELEILTLLEQRLRNKEIAEKFFISPETVKRHTINIYGKLNVHNRREAVAKAQELGMVKG